MWTECTTLRAFVRAFTLDGDVKVFELTVELRLFSQTEIFTCHWIVLFYNQKLRKEKKKHPRVLRKNQIRS